LRRTRGKIAASHFTTKTHAAASGFLRGGKMASGTVAESTDAMNCGKYSTEKPRAGNLSFGTRLNCAMCPRWRQIAQLCE
jgi:hypothetical protein